MSKEDVTHQKVSAVENAVTGLQQAVRGTGQQVTDAMQMLGQMKQELLLEQQKVKTLELAMEKVYTYINENRVR